MTAGFINIISSLVHDGMATAKGGENWIFFQSQPLTRNVTVSLNIVFSMCRYTNLANKIHDMVVISQAQ